jgi:hypothetical protein
MSDEQFGTSADAPSSLAEAAHGERETPSTVPWDDDDDMPTLIAEAPAAGFGEERLEHGQTETTGAATTTADTGQFHSVSFRTSEEEELTVPQRAVGTGQFQHSTAEFRAPAAQQDAAEGAAARFDAPAASSLTDEMNAAGSERGLSASPSVASEASPMSASGVSSGGQISLEQLSPEAIDAIARRAVELLSARVVEQVAWEVVPQLAELLIKRRLEEEGQR